MRNSRSVLYMEIAAITLFFMLLAWTYGQYSVSGKGYNVNIVYKEIGKMTANMYMMRYNR